MNIYDRDELPNGDDFPVTGGFPLPSDIDDYADPEYKFVLVNDQTGERLCDLEARFVRDEECEVEGYMDCPDVWSAESAYCEALSRVGYSVKVVKK